MADTTYGYTPGAGNLAAIDRIAGTDYPYYKIKWGAPGTVNDASAATPLPVGTELGQLFGVAPTGAHKTPSLVITNSTPTVPHGNGTYTYLQVDSTGKLWTAATQSGTWSVGITGTPSVNATLAAETTKKIGVVGIDPTQLGTLVAGSVPVVSGGNDWLWIDVGQTNTTLPSTVTGSYLEEVLAVVATAATSQVQIKDGSGTARTILPNNVAGGVGSYPIPLGLSSKLGAWQISTGAGVSVIASFHV